MEPVVFTSPRQTVRIPIINDNFVEPTEMFRVRLSSTAPGSVAVTGPDLATVTITDADSKDCFAFVIVVIVVVVVVIAIVVAVVMLSLLLLLLLSLLLL